MDKTARARARLEELHAFAPNYETFEQLFWQGLDRTRIEEAFDLVLRVVYAMLGSDGARYEQLLDRIDASAADTLRSWLDDQLARHKETK